MLNISLTSQHCLPMSNAYGVSRGQSNISIPSIYNKVDYWCKPFNVKMLVSRLLVIIVMITVLAVMIFTVSTSPVPESSWYWYNWPNSQLPSLDNKSCWQWLTITSVQWRRLFYLRFDFCQAFFKLKVTKESCLKVW